MLLGSGKRCLVLAKTDRMAYFDASIHKQLLSLRCLQPLFRAAGSTSLICSRCDHHIIKTTAWLAVCTLVDEATTAA